MTTEIRAEVFASGTTTGLIEGTHSVAYTMLCGISGTQVIPLRCTDDGLLLTSGVN